MISLAEYITEAKAPVFTNDINSIKEFCEYAKGDESEWIVNSDKTITITPVNSRVKTVGVNLKDLKELPDFIVFKGMENTGINFWGNKLEKLVPHIKGPIKSVYMMDCKKVAFADFSNVNLTYDMYIEKNSKLESFIGPKATSQLEKISIRLNKHLKELDLTGMKEWAHYNSINKNGAYRVDMKKMPAKKADNANLNVD